MILINLLPPELRKTRRSGVPPVVLTFDPVPLDTIVPFIDWGPFFSAWELHGRYPDILTDAVVGEEATRVYNDARKLLARIVAEKRYTAKAVIGFWPCNAVGDDIEVYADEQRSRVITVFHTLRQQLEKPAGQFDPSARDGIACPQHRSCGGDPRVAIRARDDCPIRGLEGSQMSRDAILALKPGDLVDLQWNHDCVTQGGSKFPERPIIKVAPRDSP